jgi:dephospho-CoA kinase
MIVVGLTGGLASGKSTVARLFQACGAVIIDADVLAREVVQPGKPAWRDLILAYGRSILRPDRTVDRRALGRLVFRHPAKLRRLNAIVHPRVSRAQSRLTGEIGRKDPDAVVIYDAPLLIEAGAHGRMDKIIVVTADRKTQIDRLTRRNGFSRAEAIRRIRTQLPLQEKTKLADYVIDGTRPVRQLRREVGRLYASLRQAASRTPFSPRKRTPVDSVRTTSRWKT